MIGSAFAFLTEDGLIQRNPGHGHPLRPEYLLTDDGARLDEPPPR